MQVKAFFMPLVVFPICFGSTTYSKAEPSSVMACNEADTNTKDQSRLNYAISICTEALAESGLPNETIADLLVSRGVAYRNAGNLNGSLDDLNRSVELNPASAANLRMRAWTLRMMQKFRQALEDYDHALSLDREWQGLLSRCDIYMSNDQFSAALKDCEESLALDRNADSLFMTGYINYQEKSYVRARELFEEAITLQNPEARAFLFLSIVSGDQNDKASAVNAAKLGLEAYPNDSDLKSRMDQLSR
jgi:tetratricopeptide (TPR) repeat protein